MTNVPTIAVGDSVPPYVHQTGFVEWARYAAANGIFNSFHHDDEAGRAAGNEPGAFGQGNLIWSYAFNMIRAWAGDDAFVREAECQFRGINQKEDIVTCGATVSAVTTVAESTLVTLAIRATNQNGSPLLVGSAVVELAPSA